MGAVTALLHADRDHSLACLVLDSPFTNLRKLAVELVNSGQYAPVATGMLTNWVIDGMLHFIKGTVKERANFEIDDLLPIEHVSQTFVPAYFLAGADDNFILPHHSEELWKAYLMISPSCVAFVFVCNSSHLSLPAYIYLKEIGIRTTCRTHVEI